MKTKTAMQELKEFLHTWTSLDGERLVCTVEYLKENVDKLLTKEKQDIIELKEKERQEWANMCIRNKKILDGLISGYCTVNEYMYNEYGKLILKEISETFLKNATKADRISDTEVFQALGETILNFPLPSPPITE